jgi:S-adenosylmethionine hydrolase
MKPVLIFHNDHFFLGEDTGVFSMMFGLGSPVEAYQYNGDLLKSATEKLALMASWVFDGTYRKNTTPYNSLKLQINSLSDADYNAERKLISGKIAYIDSCCNAVTNIPVATFEAVGKKAFTAVVSNNVRPLKITRCHTHYNPQESEVFLVYNRLGFLEITLYEGNIAALEDLKVGHNIEIQF